MQVINLKEVSYKENGKEFMLNCKEKTSVHAAGGI